jgi:hypothetical protein
MTREDMISSIVGGAPEQDRSGDTQQADISHTNGLTWIGRTLGYDTSIETRQRHGRSIDSNTPDWRLSMLSDSAWSGSA